MTSTSIEFLEALEMFARGYGGGIIYLFQYYLRGKESNIKEDFITYLAEFSCQWSFCAPESKHGEQVTSRVSPGPVVTVRGPGAGQLLWEMEVSLLPQSRKFTKSGVKEDRIGRKVEFFHYTGLRNAACPVIIKHLTFYLFIWLAELAFLAFLVGLCCWFFFFFFLSV